MFYLLLFLILTCSTSTHIVWRNFMWLNFTWSPRGFHVKLSSREFHLRHLCKACAYSRFSWCRAGENHRLLLDGTPVHRKLIPCSVSRYRYQDDGLEQFSHVLHLISRINGGVYVYMYLVTIKRSKKIDDLFIKTKNVINQKYFNLILN